MKRFLAQSRPDETRRARSPTPTLEIRVTEHERQLEEAAASARGETIS